MVAYILPFPDLSAGYTEHVCFDFTQQREEERYIVSDGSGVRKN